jgi:hypothetical protein
VAVICWLDASALIQAEKSSYPRQMFPAVWTFIEEHIAGGAIQMPKQAFDEICDGTDDLAAWCKLRKNSGLCIKSPKPIQDRYKAIADHVMGTYAIHHANRFLLKADGWVIAHALQSSGVVVTEELKLKGGSKVKIPTVCKAMGAQCTNLLKMLAALKFNG